MAAADAPHARVIVFTDHVCELRHRDVVARVVAQSQRAARTRWCVERVLPHHSQKRPQCRQHAQLRLGVLYCSHDALAVGAQRVSAHTERCGAMGAARQRRQVCGEERRRVSELWLHICTRRWYTGEHVALLMPDVRGPPNGARPGQSTDPHLRRHRRPMPLHHCHCLCWPPRCHCRRRHRDLHRAATLRASR